MSDEKKPPADKSASKDKPPPPREPRRPWNPAAEADLEKRASDD